MWIKWSKLRQSLYYRDSNSFEIRAECNRALKYKEQQQQYIWYITVSYQPVIGFRLLLFILDSALCTCSNKYRLT